MIEQMRVEPGTKAGIARRDTRDTLGIDGKEAAASRLQDVVGRLSMLQERLYAEGRHSVLLILQGLDASGKDGVVRSVFTGVNPQGCRVTSFKAPSPNELARDYLWRVHAAVPTRGEIGIFNRSHYEDAVTVRVLDLAPESVTDRRPGHIREWERMLADEGTTIVKVFLNVSKEEQRERLQERVDDPEKRWKFNPRDLEMRKRFDDYIAAYDDGDHGDLDRVGAMARGPRRPQLGQEPGGRGAAARRPGADRPQAPRPAAGDRGDRGAVITARERTAAAAARSRRR